VNTSTTVLVTGATGFVGRRLVPRLGEQDFDVRAMTRNPDRYSSLAFAAVVAIATFVIRQRR
jgi:uncharacterized protein YbjT (DUF2867 family)